jgi:hypothetical protein
MEDYKALFLQLIAHVEQEVIEYKTAENQYDTNKLGKYFSALSNEANLRDVEFAWIVLGVNNDRKVVGTQFLMDETQRQLLKHDIAVYTKQKGLDKNKLLNMLQQCVENAGENGIMLKDIYEYMQVTLPSGKSADAKKKTLTYLLGILKATGAISPEGRRWKAVKQLGKN